MKKIHFVIAAILLSSMSVSSQVLIDVQSDKDGTVISPVLYGIFFEEINHAGDGGLYAELIRNRSFEDSDDEALGWRIEVADGVVKRGALTKHNLLNEVQGNAFELQMDASKGSNLRMVNEGFWGINAVQGRTYTLTFWARGNFKGSLDAQLTDASGKVVFAETTIKGGIESKWKKFTAKMTANGNDAHAVFALVAKGKGTLVLDVVSLFPPTFKNRANGCRPDLVEMLRQLKPTFMRFPGGCFVEGQETPDNAFRWHRTIGPIEERVGHWNLNWNYRVSDGFGFHEMLQLSEDLGSKPLYVCNVGIWHGGFTPVEDIQPWVDECLNALEYANGPVTSKYGAMRAANGHPEPFNIEYIEIGNENNQLVEEQQSDRYYERYKIFQDAILAKYPDMHLIGNVAAWGTESPTWNSDVPCELLDEHYYRSPAWFADQYARYDGYERGKHDIYVGEYAVTQSYGRFGNLDAALGEAIFMMGLENNSDVVKMASYAPIFVNVNDARWMPDMIRFDSHRATGTPSYYVQKLMAQNVGTKMLKTTVTDLCSNQMNTDKKAVRIGMGAFNTRTSYKDAHLESGGKIVGIGSWENLRGQWNFGNEISQCNIEDNCMCIGSEPIVSSNYSIRVKARRNEGAEGVIVMCEYENPDSYVWLNLGGWNNTKFALEQAVGGGRVVIAEKPGMIEAGRWYDVRVDVDGDSIKGYVDGELVISAVKKKAEPELRVNASFDERTGETIVKMVNMSAESTTALIRLHDASIGKARLIRLASASGTDENSLDNPTNVFPVEQTVDSYNGEVELTILAHSLNIVRISAD